ncbi:MAG: hypothetical protein N2645_09930 [Clostridia bacterium]|nr:hypothetical protein [Clostridia bacterium]
MTNLKNSLKKIYILYWIKRKISNALVFSKWEKEGYPVPPPHIVKQKIIKYYANRFSANVLVETGTFMGDMLYAMRRNFTKLYSIELSEELYLKAQKRFENYPNINLLQGDSSEKISVVLNSVNERILFWLDGHYSGEQTAKGKLETPIMNELLNIFNHNIKDHVILIDDARLFVGTNDYPTLDSLKSFIRSHRPGYSFEVKNDIIRVYPKKDIVFEY